MTIRRDPRGGKPRTAPKDVSHLDEAVTKGVVRQKTANIDGALSPKCRKAALLGNPHPTAPAVQIRSSEL